MSAEIEKNLLAIETRIAAACTRGGRARGDVKLLAVSKLQTIEKIRAAYACGQRDFAENYAQEALDKQEMLKSEMPELRWHFIGRIQSNKAKMVAGRFALVHSVESAKVADVFNRTFNPGDRPQDILLQFNVAGEASKGGAGEAELRELLDSVLEHQNIRVMGLMVMPPLTEDAETVRPYFRRAREVLHEIRGQRGSARHPLTELSMGTSQDFETAIEEGATWIRLGTTIFGSRE